MSLNIRIVSITLIAALQGSGCATQAPQPQADPLLPETWRHADQTLNTTSGGEWWAEFANRELNQLIEQAMQDNFDLRASFQRIEQARARLTPSRSTLFPQLDIGYSAGSDTRWDENDNRTNDESDRASLTASYEVDLWGRLRSGNRAVEAALASSAYNHRTVALSLQAQIASTYFQFLAAHDRLRFAEEILANSEQLLRLVELQFREGAASRLELMQQQSSVISQQAQINDLRNSLQQVTYALDILLGQEPGTLQLQGRSLSELHLPAISAGQPVDLLQRRPDILQAEAALAAAHANVEIARTAFLPNLRLSASTSAGPLLLGDPVTQAASIAASITAPLFNAGRNRSEYRRTLAAQEEVLLNYYQAILTAAGEVQTSLLSINNLSSNLELEARRLALSEESYALAELRYKAGAADFITLLDSERSLISAQDAFVQATLARHLEAVTLFRALGGSWFKE